MKNITFGCILGDLLHLSKQKKSSLAKQLGYDISYLSKWTSGKNLPIPKNINDICMTTSKFIVDSLTEDSLEDVKTYFQIDDNMNTKEELVNYIEQLLKDSYVYTAQKSIPNLPRQTHWQEDYNSTMHVNPRLRKQYLNKDIELFIKKSNKLDFILSANLNRLPDDDKMSIADIKSDLANMKESIDTRTRILLSFEDDYSDIIFNTILIINMIAMYPSMNFEVYNCDVDSNAIISIIKDRVVHTGNFTKDKRCLLTTMSKEKSIIDDLYYSLETILKNHGTPIVEKNHQSI